MQLSIAGCLIENLGRGRLLGGGERLKTSFGSFSASGAEPPSDDGGSAFVAAVLDMVTRLRFGFFGLVLLVCFLLGGGEGGCWLLRTMWRGRE